MILDKWLSGKLQTPTDEDTLEALKELKDVTKQVKELTRGGEYWEAYRRLIGCITSLSMASQKHPTIQPEVIQRLLKWIQRMKGAIDTVIGGIGGSSYSITVSVQGLSLTVSFTVEAS